MKKLILIASVIAFAALQSCSNDEQNTETTFSQRTEGREEVKDIEILKEIYEIHLDVVDLYPYPQPQILEYPSGFPQVECFKWIDSETTHSIVVFNDVKYSVFGTKLYDDKGDPYWTLSVYFALDGESC